MDEKLQLTGLTTFDGGTLSGAQTVTQTGDVVVESHGNVTLPNDVYLWDGGSGAHTTTIKTGATWSLIARKIDLALPPFADGYDGSIVIETGGQLNVDLTEDDQWRLDGSLSLAEGALVTGDSVVNVGRIEGDGLFQTNLTSSGVVAPGQSAGELQVQGAYQQNANGKLEIELAGAVPGTGFDVLSATTASIDGTVSFALAEGYFPAPGTRFDFLTTSSGLSGNFSNVELIAPPGVYLNGFVDDTNALTRTFEILDATLAADFDEDGDVDDNDRARWELRYGRAMGAKHRQGDADGDGDTDGADFLTWQQQFGSDVAGVVASTAVPEPSTGVLLVSLAAFWIRSRRKCLDL